MREIILFMVDSWAERAHLGSAPSLANKSSECLQPFIFISTTVSYHTGLMLKGNPHIRQFKTFVDLRTDTLT